MDRILALFSSIGSALGKLGAKRLIALGLVGVALFGTILFSSFYLTRPTYETLYVGLTRDDVNRMGMALGEAGIAFDVSSDGTSVQVPVGQAEKARMFLAEKGLPTSNNAGYELFDNMGSLGLTSFMQEITRQRALEGEIAQSIRQLVAAAIPSLEASSVTVLDTSGKLLASGTDAMNGAPVMMASLERQVAAQIDENIRKQLAPYLGMDHFQTSVQVALDTDRRQTNETIYNPDSQVARSVRTVRDQGDAQNNRNNGAVGVEQNIPQEEIAGGAGENSSDKKDRREETTNYEINSKTISTVSDGFNVKKLAVAVVIDRSRLKPSDKEAPAPANYVDDQVNRIRQMVATASGLDPDRGDIINVTAVDFVSNDDENMQPVSTPIWQSLSKYTSGLVNGAALVIAVLLIMFLGVRPLMREMHGNQLALSGANESALAGPENMPALPNEASKNEGFDGNMIPDEDGLQDLRSRMRVPPQNRLDQMISMDEDRFANVLREWVQEDDNKGTPAQAA